MNLEARITVEECPYIVLVNFIIFINNKVLSLELNQSILGLNHGVKKNHSETKWLGSY